MRMDWDLGNISFMGFPRRFFPLAVQVEVEGRAFARCGFEPDATAMPLDDLLDKGEPDASASFLPVRRVVESLEDPEDLAKELGFDPDAVVLDVEDVPLRAVRRIERLPKAYFHETLGLVVVFDGVGYEITEYFGDPRLVADNARQRARDNHARMPFGEHSLHHQADFVDHPVEIGFLDGE